MSYNLKNLIGFAYNGLGVSLVDIDNSQYDPNSPTDYVPGSQTYNVLPGSFGGNNSDDGLLINQYELVTAASNPGDQINGTPLGQPDSVGNATNPKAIGQIVYNDETYNIDSGQFVASPSATYDVLGYSADGTSLLVGLTSAYDPYNPNDPYDGEYNIISDKNIDGNATPSNFPQGVQTFTPTNTYTGGPTTASPGMAGDLTTVSNALVGLTVPGNGVTGTYAVTLNQDGSYSVTATSSTLGFGTGTFSIDLASVSTSAAAGSEGQPILAFNGANGTIYGRLVGWAPISNQNTAPTSLLANVQQYRYLLQITTSSGAPVGTTQGTTTGNDPQYDIITFGNASRPPSNAAVNYTFNNFGVAPCFCAGTLIATPDGQQAIETLKAGDLVLTLDGPARAIRWLGRSTVASLFADPIRHFPIRIAAGALGENLPVRDLLVSPDHAMFLSGFLVQAGALVNGTTITRQTSVPAAFTYYHLELDAHALVLAEGAATETFVDNVDRRAFDNWAEHTAAVEEMVELPYARAKSARQVPLLVRTLIAERARALVVTVPNAA
jgi:hypothetical protein